MMTGALGLFLWELERGSSLETARTMAVSAVVLAEMFYLFNSRYLIAPVLTREGLLGNGVVLIAAAACGALQLAFVHAGPLQAVFGSTDLSAAEWSRVLLVGVAIFAIAETEKLVIRRFGLFGNGRSTRPPAEDSLAAATGA
jgi:magnesium-transporting ATPase (P-type)